MACPVVCKSPSTTTLYEALQVEARQTGASLAELVRRSVSDRLGMQSVGDRLAILNPLPVPGARVEKQGRNSS